MRRVLSIVAVLGLTAAACGGDTAALSVDAYAREIQAVETSFLEDSP